MCSGSISSARDIHVLGALDVGEPMLAQVHCRRCAANVMGLRIQPQRFGYPTRRHLNLLAVEQNTAFDRVRFGEIGSS